MIKLTFGLVLSLLTFAPSSAFAFPKVGDQATYDVNLQQGEMTVRMNLISELVSFDAANNSYLHRTTQQISGQADQVDESSESAENMMSDESIDQILANCSAAGGVSQTLSVPAGTFSTCAMPVSDEGKGLTGTVWIAKVPFGFVQSHTIQGNQVVDLALRSFK